MLKMSLEMEKRYPNISLFTDFFSNFLKYYSEVNYAKKNLLFPLDKIFFEKFKSRFNEVLFILGTGESINLITKKQWAFIDSNRTIGINQWFVHEYIPNFLICEGFRNNERRSDFAVWRDQRLLHYLNTNINVTLLAKDFRKSFFAKEILHLLDGKRAFAFPKFNIMGREYESMIRAIKALSRFGILDKLPFFSKATITQAIALGCLLGFKEIVLCGVDLNNGLNFWEATEYIKDFSKDAPPSLKRNRIHPTMDPRHTKVTVDKIIYSLNDYFLKPRGVKLKVLSESSALHPEIEAYQIPTVNI